MPTNPDDGTPYNRSPESDTPTTRKEKLTEQLLVEMTHALNNNNQNKAETLAQQIVELWDND